MSDQETLLQITKELGGLSAQAKENSRKFETLFDKIDALTDELRESRAEASRAIAKAEAMEDHLARLEERVNDEIQPAVDEFKALKNRGLGVLGGIGLMSGGVGAALVKAVDKI